MLRRIAAATAATFILAACGGGDGGPQAQTEGGAVDAVVSAMRGTLRGNGDAVLGFTNEACRATIDEDELRLGLLFLRGLMESDDVDLDDVVVTGEIEDFDGDTATVAVSYELPDGGDLDEFLFSGDDVDAVYENGRWVGEDCDFGDAAAIAEDEAADLAEERLALGHAGTRDDPIPRELAVPIGSGFRLAITGYEPNAAETIEATNGYTPFLDEDEHVARVSYQIAYDGSDEPIDAYDVNVTAFESAGVELDTNACNFPGEPRFNDKLFAGATASYSSCITGRPDQLGDPVVGVRVGFGDDLVYFDPTDVATAPTTIEATPLDPDGELAAGRAAASPPGTPVDLGEGWTVTVESATLDGTAEVLAHSDSNDAPIDGFAYSLVSVTMTYDGDEPASPSFVILQLVGDDAISRSPDCSFSSIPDELDTFAELLPGTTVKGTYCFTTPTNQHDSTVLYARGGFFSDNDEFFALR